MPGVKVSETGGTTLSTLDLEKGYYRTSADSKNVLKCLREEACVGGVDSSNYCASGYQGPCTTNPSRGQHISDFLFFHRYPLPLDTKRGSFVLASI